MSDHTTTALFPPPPLSSSSPPPPRAPLPSSASSATSSYCFERRKDKEQERERVSTSVPKPSPRGKQIKRVRRISSSSYGRKRNVRSACAASPSSSSCVFFYKRKERQEDVGGEEKRSGESLQLSPICSSLGIVSAYPPSSALSPALLPSSRLHSSSAHLQRSAKKKTQKGSLFSSSPSNLHRQDARTTTHWKTGYPKVKDEEEEPGGEEEDADEELTNKKRKGERADCHRSDLSFLSAASCLLTRPLSAFEMTRGKINLDEDQSSRKPHLSRRTRDGKMHRSIGRGLEEQPQIPYPVRLPSPPSCPRSRRERRDGMAKEEEEVIDPEMENRGATNIEREKKMMSLQNTRRCFSAGSAVRIHDMRRHY